MIAVRILTKSAESGHRLKAALEWHGFSASFVVVSDSAYDVIIADQGVVCPSSPVVLFTKREDVRQRVSEAVVANEFKALNDKLSECLELCRKG